MLILKSDYNKALHQIDKRIHENPDAGLFVPAKPEKEQATRLYEKVLELNPQDYSSYFNLMKLYSTRKNNDKIVSLIEKDL